MSPFVLLETPSNRLGFAANGQNDEVGKMGKMAASVVSSLVQTDGSFASQLIQHSFQDFARNSPTPENVCRRSSVVGGRWSVVGGRWSVVSVGVRCPIAKFTKCLMLTGIFIPIWIVFSFNEFAILEIQSQR